MKVQQKMSIKQMKNENEFQIELKQIFKIMEAIDELYQNWRTLEKHDGRKGLKRYD